MPKCVHQARVAGGVGFLCTACSVNAQHRDETRDAVSTDTVFSVGPQDCRHSQQKESRLQMDMMHVQRAQQPSKAHSKQNSDHPAEITATIYYEATARGLIPKISFISKDQFQKFPLLILGFVLLEKVRVDRTFLFGQHRGVDTMEAEGHQDRHSALRQCALLIAESRAQLTFRDAMVACC